MKEKVFFIRGLVRESGHWSGFLDRFSETFPQYEPVALDIPGNGKYFHEKSPTSVPQMKNFMRQEFLKHQNGKPCHMFAISLGAMVGVQWMFDHPADFFSAALLNTSLKGLSPFYHRLQPKNYPTILRLLCSSSLELRERKILEITSHNLSRRDELVATWTKIQESRPVNRANSLRQLMAAARFTPPKEKPAPKILLLSSRGDKLVSHSCTEALGHHWNLPVHLHETAGHDLTLDAPDWVLSKYRDFIA